jgi:hypothetical protein
MSGHDNSGVLFRNERKNGPNSPDYNGSALIEGKEYWVAGWIKTAGANSKNPGSKFMSLAFTPKQPTPPKANAQPSTYEDDIPF